jgi:hypothetical protein
VRKVGEPLIRVIETLVIDQNADQHCKRGKGSWASAITICSETIIYGPSRSGPPRFLAGQRRRIFLHTLLVFSPQA